MHPFTRLSLPAGAAAVHWFEQASFALTDGPGTLLLVDPYAPHERPAERFIHAAPPLDEAEWPPHFVLFTHAHEDHTNSETVARIHAAAPRARYLGPQESIDQIVAETAVDAEQCDAIVPGQRLAAGTMAINAVYAKPPDGDADAGIEPPDTPHFGYVVEAGSRRIYLSGDPINNFADHRPLTDAVAALRPDVGFFTNHPAEGEFPFFEGSARMARLCGVRIACPAHYQCFVSRNYDPAEWAAAVAAEGVATRILPHNSHHVFTAGG